MRYEDAVKIVTLKEDSITWDRELKNAQAQLSEGRDKIQTIHDELDEQIAEMPREWKDSDVGVKYAEILSELYAMIDTIDDIENSDMEFDLEVIEKECCDTGIPVSTKTESPTLS